MSARGVRELARQLASFDHYPPEENITDSPCAACGLPVPAHSGLTALGSDSRGTFAAILHHGCAAEIRKALPPAPVTETAVLCRKSWWRALDGEPVEGPFDTKAEVEALIKRLIARRAGARMRAAALPPAPATCPEHHGALSACEPVHEARYNAEMVFARIDAANPER